MAIIFVRTVIVFTALFISMRLLGKRQLGEVQVSELVVSVLIANIASLPIQDIGIPLLNGLIPVLTVFCCELVLAGLPMKNVKLRALMCGKACLLIENGKILQHEMRENRLTIDELAEELRNKNITDISKVKYAILETDGVLNVILQAQEKPVTAAMLGIETEESGLPIIVVNGGRVMEQNLRVCGRDLNWLEKELKARGVKNVRDVYIMSVDSQGQIYFAAKEKTK